MWWPASLRDGLRGPSGGVVKSTDTGLYSALLLTAAGPFYPAHSPGLEAAALCVWHLFA